jgi:hypothetical protein
MLVKVAIYYVGEAWCARSVGHDIFTQGQTVHESYRNILEALALHFEPEL